MLRGLVENEAFYMGVSLGINLYQQRIITAHEKKQSLKIGENLYYIQEGNGYRKS